MHIASAECNQHPEQQGGGEGAERMLKCAKVKNAANASPAADAAPFQCPAIHLMLAMLTVAVQDFLQCG